MSDTEMERKDRFARSGSNSDSSDEEEAPRGRSRARHSSSEEGLQDSSPEGPEHLQDTASSTESSAPKVSAGEKDDTDSEDELDREEDRHTSPVHNVADNRTVEKEVEEDEPRHLQNGHHEDEGVDSEDDEVDRRDNKHDKDDSSDTEGEDEEKEKLNHNQQQSDKEDDVEDEEEDIDSVPVVAAPGRASPPRVVLETPSPVQNDSPSPVPQDEEDEVDEDEETSAAVRKSSNGSSSSYGDEEEEERASSMSPEPRTAVITAPPAANKVATSPNNSSQKDITKIYTEALVQDEQQLNSGGFAEKIVRSKPAGGDITQIYTASLQKEQQSPKLERARGGKPVKDITQLYTAAFAKSNDGKGPTDMPSPNRPRRNSNITKLYTGGFESAKNNSNFRGKPNDEITNPRKHNMATSLDKDGIREAYSSVMSDNNGVEWAAFKFDEQNQLVVSGTGEEFAEFKSQFGPDDRGFGYIKIQTGDEMSKRHRFILITWVGSNVSVMKKAKMSTDKLLVKEIIQNLSVELQMENPHELSLDHLKAEVDKAGGAS